MVPDSMMINIYDPKFPEDDRLVINDLVRTFNLNPNEGIQQIKDEEIVEILEDDEYMPYNRIYDVSLAQFLVGKHASMQPTWSRATSDPRHYCGRRRSQ